MIVILRIYGIFVVLICVVINGNDMASRMEVDDYSEGPIQDQLNGFGEMWVFGKDVKGQEVYIKITLEHPNTSTIVISFHTAEYPMKYPLKGEEDT